VHRCVEQGRVELGLNFDILNFVSNTEFNNKSLSIFFFWWRNPSVRAHDGTVYSRFTRSRVLSIGTQSAVRQSAEWSS
jgi:hypothetical protein